MKVSIIIRTKNEERWISACLEGVFDQDYDTFEVIVVDNNSEDATVKRAKQFDTKIITIGEFRPGRAINYGVENCDGDIVVCLSGHCIPVHRDWLRNLVEPLGEQSVAGVYGRQQPMAFSKDRDKRDLITIFGLDKRTQKKDSYFHNANSAFRKALWQEIPFDEETLHIEDRIWAYEVLKAGYEIRYEPSASVYHYHGVHQDDSPERRRRIVKILERLTDEEDQVDVSPLRKMSAPEPGILDVAALIPVRGESIKIGGRRLLEFSIEQAKRSRYVKHVFVLTDSEETALYARALGAEVPFLRPSELSKDYVTVSEVLRFSIDQLKKRHISPDMCVILEETYPFRNEGFIDDLIESTIREGAESAIAIKKESRAIWRSSGGERQMISSLGPRSFKAEAASVSLFGLGFVTYPAYIRNGSMGSDNRLDYVITDPVAAIEVRQQEKEEDLLRMIKLLR